jgi:hypothetical protein
MFVEFQRHSIARVRKDVDSEQCGRCGRVVVGLGQSCNLGFVVRCGYGIPCLIWFETDTKSDSFLSHGEFIGDEQRAFDYV